MSDLKKILECPCCYDIPLPGTISTGLCANGHVVCTDCTIQILRHSDCCPLCRHLQFYVVRGHSLTVKIIQTLTNHLTYSCPYHNCMRTMTGNLYLQHLKDCEYKPIDCPAANCIYNAPIADYLNDRHPECLDIVYRNEDIGCWDFAVDMRMVYCFDTNIARVNETFKPSLLVGKWNHGEHDSHAYINMIQRQGSIVIYAGWMNKLIDMESSMKDLRVDLSVYIHSASGIIGHFVSKSPVYEGDSITQNSVGVSILRQTLFNWAEWSNVTICPACNIRTPHFHIKARILRN